MPLYRGSRRLAMVRRVSTAFSALINFRNTSGYVTDGSGQIYCLGSADQFPTSRGGQTFGWDAFALSADRDNAVDPRFAGINYATNGTTRIFQLTLPRAGVYNVNYSIGDAGGFSQSTGIVIKDNTTTLSTSGTIATSGTQFADIAGTIHATSAAWIANTVSTPLTFATTSFVLELSGAGAAGTLTHLKITQ